MPARPLPGALQTAESRGPVGEGGGEPRRAGERNASDGKDLASTWRRKHPSDAQASDVEPRGTKCCPFREGTGEKERLAVRRREDRRTLTRHGHLHTNTDLGPGPTERAGLEKMREADTHGKMVRPPRMRFSGEQEW